MHVNIPADKLWQYVRTMRDGDVYHILAVFTQWGIRAEMLEILTRITDG